ncbi:MAG: UDP-N-acetylmuramoyl-L-alanyl-D-glutamate--2,6-diaminopimelate ligase [Anaerolineae bacterium]|nr:UDP-N-acetylmuramoyl-L-alanyl-D-glutamate--2,6-diaminopimelate ligase [Anaerolineae bacterium]
MAKLLSQLLDALSPDAVLTSSADVTISAPVVESSRDVEPGGLFVARPGLSSDGHDFIADAIQRGAAAVVGERDIRDLNVPYVRLRDAQEATGFLAAAYHDYPAHKLVIIGVTGTDGKTTTSTIIHSILQQHTQGNAGLISTVNAVIGDEKLDTGLHVTTPSAPQIQMLLARMVANGLTHCVLEMTSHGLAQGRLNGVDVDVAVLTNVTHEHLDYHGTFEAYRTAKGRMFAMLAHSERKPAQPKVAVINGDDANADYFASFPADAVLRYGMGRDADVRAEAVDYEPDHIRVQVNRPAASFVTQLAGQFNVMNVLAAVAAVDHLGVPVDAIQQGIRHVEAIPGRMERIDEGQDFTAIVDFAHTPNALKNALEAARAMLQPGQRLIAIFGSAGLRDREKRRLMAETSARLADVTVLTAEDPRTESLTGILQIMAQACESQGGVEGQTFIRVPDRGEALYRACQMANAGDIVIACGKGHEQSMCFGTVEYPWDDREGMRAALRGTPLQTLPTAHETS